MVQTGSFSCVHNRREYVYVLMRYENFTFIAVKDLELDTYVYETSTAGKKAAREMFLEMEEFLSLSCLVAI